LNCHHSPKMGRLLRSWLFSGMALPPDRLPTTGVAVVNLFTNTVRFASKILYLKWLQTSFNTFLFLYFTVSGYLCIPFFLQKKAYIVSFSYKCFSYVSYACLWRLQCSTCIDKAVLRLADIFDLEHEAGT
jgi:hypothetical protein